MMHTFLKTQLVTEKFSDRIVAKLIHLKKQNQSQNTIHGQLPYSIGPNSLPLNSFHGSISTVVAKKEPSSFNLLRHVI